MQTEEDSNLKEPLKPVDTSSASPPTNSSVHISSEIQLAPLLGPSNFNISPKKLQDLVDPKNKKLLNELGGIDGLSKALMVDPTVGLNPNEQFSSSTPATAADTSNPISSAGLSSAWLQRVFAPQEKALYTENSFSQRSSYFGHNALPSVRERNIFEYMWMAMHDKILVLLTIAAVASLAIGIYDSTKSTKTSDSNSHGPEWIEGVAIIIAILIVVLVQSINDFQKERQFRKLNAKKEQRKVKVLRAGEVTLVSIYDIQVGDICLLEPGDMLNVDGVLTQAHNLKCDESSATGESDLISKQAYSERSDCKDPFILSGSKVNEGVGRFIVTAVGPNSYFGKTMLGLRVENDDTPLQIKLDSLADNIAGMGIAIALLLFITLVTKFIVTQSIQGWNQISGAEIGSRFIDIIIETIIIVVVAVPEGLPLAVTLALAYATTRMTKDNNLVRVLASCETMGGATTICSDKTGTLTQNKMTVVAGLVGLHLEFKENKGIERLKEKMELSANISNSSFYPAPNSTSMSDKEFFNLLTDGIAMNSTAFEEKDEKGNKIMVGNKTESALLEFIRKLGMVNFQQIRDDSSNFIVQVYPFSSERKSMSIIVKRVSYAGTCYRVYTKGASEIVLKFCDSVLEFRDGNFEKLRLSDSIRKQIQTVILQYADQSLRTISMAYYDFTEEEIKDVVGVPVEIDGSFQQLTPEMSAKLENHFIKRLIFIGLVGIEDPLREGVAEAVAKCQAAGVFVRMVTGDNVRTAKAIASKCGIFMKGGLVMEGSRFRNLGDEEMERILPRLQVLARSSPTDKQILVKKLKEMGETVAVTGDGTNDGPALKMADVGFSMGIAGTEVAKEASSIILMDDNFSSIVKAMMWGRCVSDAVKKFLQFQLTVNVSAVALAFISSVSSSTGSSILTAVQLLWINLIMDTLAALALATDPPSEELLDRYPESKRSPLITVTMLKMIIGQAAFQIVVGLLLYYLGAGLIPPSYLEAYTNNNNVTTSVAQQQILGTFVFNTFVFLQLFNELNCRRIDSKWNIFSGVHRNMFFIVIMVVVLVVQVILVEYGGVVFQCFGLPGAMWGYSIFFSFMTLPIGLAIRMTPSWDGCTLCGVGVAIPDNSRVVMTKERLQWQHSIGQVRAQISVFKALRGTNRPGSSSGHGSAQDLDAKSIGSGSNRTKPSSSMEKIDETVEESSIISPDGNQLTREILE